MDEEKMWKSFYEKIVVEAENKRNLQNGPSNHEMIIQNEDNGFFENLGTGFAEKVKVQEFEESLKIDNEEKVEEEEVEKDCKIVEEEFCLSKKREELFAEKETKLKGSDDIGETDSEPEETTQNVYDIVTQSLGLNIEELYTGLLFITQHQIGFDVPDRVNQNEIFDYLQKVFNIDNEIHEKILDETRQMEAPQMHLNIEVSEAKELVPKDANGKSDPFCVLYLESSPTRRYNTAVKTETLTPVWQERFEMPLTNPENDTLNVEVWDFDAAETVPEKMSKVKNIKGVRGLVKLAKEIAITATAGNHDNEFIGCTKIPLKDIPVTGHIMWYSLDKKHKGKQRGLVKLRLAFNTEHDVQVAFQEHRHLIKMLLLHELETQTYDKYNWSENWSGPADIIILQHGIQRGLKYEQLNLIKYIEYSNIQQEYLLNFRVYYDLLNKIHDGLINNDIFNNDELLLFWESTKKILYTALNFIRKLRRLQLDKEIIMRQLVSILRIISLLKSLEVPESINLFCRKLYNWLPLEILDDDRITVIEGLEIAVKQGAFEWFEYLDSNNKLQKDTDEEALHSYIKIIQLVRIDLQRALEIYEKIFIKTLNFSYTKILYMSYEKRVSDMCTIVVEDVCGRLKRIEIEGSDDPELNLGTTLFELYLTVQRFAGVGQNLCQDEFENLKIQNYYQWFRAGVAHWLEIAVYKALKRIERAIDFDNLQAVDSSVQYSSSAVDTLTIFYQIKVFWTQLAWPDVEGAYAFIAKIVDDICKCCIVYVDKMSQKAENIQIRENSENSNNTYNEQFDVSIAWCYAINNIDYIKTSIEPLTKDLGLDKVIEILNEKKSQQESERCRETLQLIVDNAKDTVNNKIHDMLDTIANKMLPAMNRYLMEGAELTDTTSYSMDRLMSYLDENLIILRDNLNDDNFEKILFIIWDLMSNILLKLINNNLDRRRPPTFYSNLYKTLQTLIQFFNFKKDEKLLKNYDVLKNIENVLKLYGLETTDLINKYYFDRIEEQNNSDDTSNGLLTVKAYFYSDTLYLQILNARNLKPIDSNGKCDSYVKIRLLPEEYFINTKSCKTNTHKETLFPLYDESFIIPLTPEQRQKENATVMFEIKDKDFLRTKFMAEAFLSFNDIKDSITNDGFTALEQIHLNLTRPNPESSEAINVLLRRKGDNQAQNFVSKIQSKYQ